MTYRSPYSSRRYRRAQRAALWPKLAGILVVVLLCVVGVLALYKAGFTLSIVRSGGEATAPPSAVAAAPGTPAGELTPTAAAGRPGPPSAGGVVGSPGASPARAASPGASPVVNARDMRSVAQAYVDRWNAKDYSGMYDLISSADQGNITRDKFVARYQGIAEEAGLTAVQATLGDATPGVAQFPMRVAMQSSLVGSITEDNTLPLRQDGDRWRVAWTPSLIFKDLGDGLIRFIPDTPERGRILDAKGRVLAQQGLVTQIGVVPGQIKDEPQLLAGLSKALGIPPDVIKSRYAKADPTWFVPIKTMPENLPPDLDNQLKALPGVAERKVKDRVYPYGSLAAHIVGYVGEVNADDLKTLAAKGYTAGDKIGRAGIESWGEQYLAGKKGGQITVIGTNGAVRTVIAQRKSEPAADIQLTIDIDLQRALEEALGDRPSSGVILDPATGGVLAMASHPTFDPNGFILGFSDADWAKLNDSKLTPLINRAAQGVYPSGSIFKVIPATAAVNELGFTADTVIDCPATFSVPGQPNVWRDWTYPDPQGPLSLKNALVRSCDTVFYQIAVKLNEKDPYLLPNYARAFGLGKPTGLEELPEASGLVPDPKWKEEVVHDGWAVGDAINFSIGQGYFLATPLQMANLYNAIANGGSLLRPFIAAKVTTPDGKIVRATERKEIAKLPTQKSLPMIHQAMVDITTAPNGTSLDAFRGSPIVVAGKTGTAEKPPLADNAWFASFAPADAPKLTVITMVEHGGAGSKVAAPVARHVYDVWAGMQH